MQQAMRQAALAEWQKLPPSEMACLDQHLRQQGASIDDVVNRGVFPTNSRLAQLRASCRGQAYQQVATSSSPFVVDGLALGGQIIFGSEAYQKYQCNPSEKFPGFTWCHKEEAKTEKRTEITSSNSILHAPDGTAWYVNRYIEPAFFGPNDVRAEIDRLSAKFGETAREFPMPQREGLPNAIIAVWGGVQLQQLNGNEVANVAADGPHDGILISFLGDLERSAKANVPVYRLTGGAGFVWAATFRNDGRGVLRFLTIDASQLVQTSYVAANGVPSIPTEHPNLGCVPTSPGPGFRINGGVYVITKEFFDPSANVEGSIKTQFGDDAALADWQALKTIFLTKDQLATFFDQVGIPRQSINGPCDNFLVSNGGRLRLGNGLWFFIARHDGSVPDNWAVFNSIDNHILDLGRWSHRSQALIFLRDKSHEALSVNQSEAQRKPAEADAAKRAADEEAQRKIAEAEAATRAADKSAEQAAGYKRQLEQQQKQQNLILIAIAVLISIIASVGTVLIVRQKKRVKPLTASSSTVHSADVQPSMNRGDAELTQQKIETQNEIANAANVSGFTSVVEKTTDVVDLLAKFAELRANGVLTDEEFLDLKRKVTGLPPDVSSQSDYINKLRSLRDQGYITDEEFQSKVLASISESASSLEDR